MVHPVLSLGKDLCKLMCINWWITDLLLRRKQKMQTLGICFGICMFLYIVYMPLFWKETTSHEAVRRDAPNIFCALSHLASGWRSSHWTFQAPFRQYRIFMFTFFFFFYLFRGYICKAERTGEAIFATLDYKCPCLQDLFFKMCLAFECKSSWLICILFDTLYLQCKEQYFPLKGA